MAGMIGKIYCFAETLETWPIYIERLDQYFTVNEIAEGKKLAALLSLMGSKTYGLLRTLTKPDLPSNKSYLEVCEILAKHLSPRPLLIAERFRFHKRDQIPGESVSAFITMSRKLTKFCEFGNFLNEALRDRFVCGLINEQIQKRLLSEENLTYDKSVKIALAMESAIKDSSELQLHSKPSVTVNKVYNGGKDRGASTSTKCYRCGYHGHIPDRCKFKDAACRQCGKKGHLQSVCRSKETKYKGYNSKHQLKPKSKKVNAVVNDVPREDHVLYDVVSHIDIYTVDKSDNDVIKVFPKVENVVLEMELDTGSAISAITFDQYQKHFSEMKIEETDITLKTYTGEKFKPVGVLKVNVCYESQTQQLDLYVVKSGGTALFGRDWLNKIQLNWKSIKSINKIEKTLATSPKEVAILLDEFKDVFQDGIGKLKDMKAKLVLKDEAKPKFCKARPVPYSLRSKVEVELDKLEETNIITKVKHSEWATPIVPVVKQNGGVRICGDFKVTVSPQLCVEQYPLPLITDIFATLANGEKFSKIDLRQAYLQMEMDEQSKQLLTINTHKGLYQYNRMMFGISSAPAIWQRAMDQVLQGIPGTQCMLDDMIITGMNDREHLDNLRRVLCRLQEYGLRANLNKCEFFKDEIVFCGYKIDKDGLHKTKEKIDAVVNAKRPENVGQVQSLLGLVNYYHRFLPDLSTIMRPLNQLLEKNHKWFWTKECEKSFQEIKRMMISDEVLTHYDVNLPVKLACDASPYGIGAVLSHTMRDGSERPIAYASRSLTSAERNYAQIDKEALKGYIDLQAEIINGRLVAHAEQINTVELPLYQSWMAAYIERHERALHMHQQQLKTLQYVHNETYCNYLASLGLDMNCTMEDTGPQREYHISAAGCQLSPVWPMFYKRTESRDIIDSQLEVLLVSARRIVVDTSQIIVVFLSIVVLKELFGSVLWIYIRRSGFVRLRIIFETSEDQTLKDT